MQLLLVRHAESSNNRAAADGTGGRVPDPTLTDRGFAQATALASAWSLPGYPRPDVLVTSLMRRTIETIAPSADTLDLPVLAQADTFEIGGPYEGAWADEVPHPGSARSVLAGLSGRLILPDFATEDGWHTAGFEAEAARLPRAKAVVRRLAEEHPDGVVVLVTHGAFGSHLLQAALGTNARLRLANTGTALVELDPGRAPRLNWFNRVDHLTPELLPDQW